MKEIELRATSLLVALVFIGCGSSSATDFFSPENGGTESGGGAGTPGGGTGGAAQGGSAGAPASGAGGMNLGGNGGAASGGAAGSTQGGSAGDAAGGAGAGSGGTIAGGGHSQGGTAGTIAGSSGTGARTFSCGSLMCTRGQQFCRRNTLSGGAEQRMCLPFVDSCTSLDCSCFCKPPAMDPCGPASACTCSGEEGRVTVTCTGL